MWIAKGCAIMSEGWDIRNPEQRAALIQYIEDHKDEPIQFEVKRGTRTIRQNNALYAYWREVAAKMLAKGLDMRTVIKEGVPIDPTMELVKHQMWTPVQVALTGKKESSALTTAEVDQVYQRFSQFLAERQGINVTLGRLYGD